MKIRTNWPEGSRDLINHAIAQVNRVNATSITPNNYRHLYRTRTHFDVATFTLRLESSQHPFHRMTAGIFNRQHRMSSLCYHGHYAFFEALFAKATLRGCELTIETSAPFSGRSAIKYTSFQDFLDKAPNYDPKVGGSMCYEHYQNLCECS